MAKHKPIYTALCCLLLVCSKPCAQNDITGIIKGRVITADNKPVAFATVILKDAGNRTATDKSGFFVFTSLPALQDTLIVSSIGIQTYIFPVELARGETLNTGVLEARYNTVTLQDVEITGRIATSYKSDYTFSATKTQTPLINVPQSVSTVTKELIQDRMEFNLKDAMNNVAGANQYSGFDEYTIRGFRAENAHLINGLRSYNTTLTNPMLVNVERIEVVKGPVSVLYGNADPGGTINLVTKKPLADTEFGVDLYRGSWNNIRAQADVTGPVNQPKTLLYCFNAGYENTGSFRNQYFLKAFQIAPSFSYVPNDRIQLNADFSISHTGSIADRGQPGLQGNNDLNNTPITLSVTQPGDHLDETNITSIISFSYKVNSHITINSSALNYITRQQLAEHGIQGYIKPDSVYLYYTRKNFNTVTNTISNFATFTFNTGGFKHQLLAGYDFINSNVTIDEFNGELPGAFGRGSGIVGTLSLTHPAPLKRPVSTYKESDIDPDDDADVYTTHGIYLQEQASYKKWQLLIGLRGEFYSAPGDDGDPGTHENVFLPRVAVTYSVNPNVNVYATYNNGFDPYEASINMQVYDAALKPIYSQLYEAGAKADLLKNRLSASIAIYQLTLRNVAVNANDLANPDLFVQRGKEQATGVETELDGNLLPGLNVTLSYAHNIAKVIQTEVPLEKGAIKENAPRNSSSSWVKYTFGKGFVKGFSLSAGHTQVGLRNTLTPGLTLPAYCVIDAGVGYTYKRLRAAVNVYNIASTVYWTGGYNYSSKWPGAPRNYMVNLEYRFGK